MHAAGAGYSLRLGFPVDYPDQRAVTDYLKRQRDDFVEYAQHTPPTGRPAPYSLDVEGTEYRSAGTRSLVFDVENDEGAAHQGHPDTSYEVFNYDLVKGAPITWESLFRPGVDPVGLLFPIVAPKLAEHFGAEVIPALREAGAKAYQHFAITDDAVIFFFGESQLGNSDAGPYRISVARSRLGSALAIPPVPQAPPCGSGQVVVTAERPLSGATHRGVRLTFTLAAGASPCTLTGYPGVDSGAGGPLLHAERTVSGYLGGLPDDAPTTVTLSALHPAHAIVEGDAVDAAGNQCPTYTALLVTVPDTSDTSVVATTIDTCTLAVHPIGSDA